MRPRPFQISFTVTILTAFALLFVTAVWLVASGYRQTGARAALVTAERSLAQAAETAAASTLALIRPVVALATVVPEFAPLGDAAALTSRDTAALLALLGAEPAVQVISVGLADGTLRQVARATSLARDKVPVLPASTAFVVRDVSLSSRQESWAFLDAGLQPLGQLALASTEPDARLTQWYLRAQDGLVHVSTLYELALVGRPGLSVSRRMPGSNAVFSLDITLEQLAGFLNGLRASPNSLVFLFTEDGILLAHPRQDLAAIAQAGGRIDWTTLRASADPVLRLVWDAYAQGRLRPGHAESLAGPNSALVVRLAEVGDLPPPRLLLAVAAPLSDFTAPLDAALQEGTVRAVLALLGGLVASGILAWRISHPLRALTQEAAAIQRLEFQPRTQVRSHIAEVARLAGAMEGMKSALRVFGAYVPRNLVGRLMQEQAAGRLGGEKRRITVMFSDVEGFTSLAEGVPPEELMHIASAYFEEITGELLSCHATIDKYIGDAVMALWNAPQDDGSHAQNACRAALQARLLTDRLCGRFEARGWPRLRTRFGVHTGEAVVGNVGSSDRMSYTAIGSMVNLASRLEGMNKSYGTRILISEATREAAGGGFVTRPVDLVLAKGSDQPTELHELLGFAVVDSIADAPLLPDRRIAVGLPAWRRMIGAYRAARFEEAAAALAEAGDPAADPLAALYADRLARLRAGTPPDWSPVLRSPPSRWPVQPPPTTPPRKRIKLALQGGGSHGAFTWGVLDRLLQDDRIEIEAVVGTSAGAMNTALLADGLAAGGPDLARRMLRTFWERTAELAAASPMQPTPLDRLSSPGSMAFSPGWRVADVMLKLFSPYQINPLNRNPLRDVLEEVVDFARLRAAPGPPAFVCATNVLNGRLRVFERRELSAAAVMASACLPQLFQAVEVDGQHYWDGGFSGNPPIFPLIYMGGGQDIVIVQLNPINIPDVPRDVRGIMDRINTLAFNSSLMREMRMIRFVTELIDRGDLSGERYLRLFIHTIDAEAELAALAPASKLNADREFLDHLFALGSARAEAFLQEHWDAVGIRSSTDVEKKFC